MQIIRGIEEDAFTASHSLKAKRMISPVCYAIHPYMFRNKRKPNFINGDLEVSSAMARGACAVAAHPAFWHFQGAGVLWLRFHLWRLACRDEVTCRSWGLRKGAEEYLQCDMVQGAVFGACFLEFPLLTIPDKQEQ